MGTGLLACGSTGSEGNFWTAVARQHFVMLEDLNGQKRDLVECGNLVCMNAQMPEVFRINRNAICLKLKNLQC